MLDRTVVEAAEHFGDAVALRADDGRSVSFAELAARSGRLAGLLADRFALREGTLVALCTADPVEYLVTYAALARLGAVTAGVSPVLSAAERATCIESIGAPLALGDPDLDPGAGVPLTAVPADSPGGRVPPLLAPDDDRMACVVFTSGTTGPPKAAVFRNRQLRAVCDIDLGPGWGERWGGGGPMIVSTQLPHVGFMTKLVWYLRMGGTLHVLSKWRADDVLRLIAAERVEVLGAIAPQLALMLRSPLMDDLDVSSVGLIIAGGAASPPALVAEARRRFGAGYSIRYSSTESGGVGLATAPDAPDDEALHTVGRPRTGVEVRIVDPGGEECPDDEVGELWLRSGAMADGYLNAPEATVATFGGGWLHTGDLAARQPDGCVRIVGRSDDRYIRGGYNVAPAEVEDVLGDHPAVEAIAVVPRDDEVMGQVGVAVVAVRTGHAAPDLDQLRAHCEGRLARWKQPEDLMIVDALPLTPMHKIDRRGLIELVNVTGSRHG
jgi:acyl-CoA synthetase (AMP-forming)/AMP-acid ligase II